VNWWQKIWHVTLPLISPTILLKLILGIIGSFQVFGLAFVTTGGGPVYAPISMRCTSIKQPFAALTSAMAACWRGSSLPPF
jgi:ABC-type sugar transport system permease subunit